MLPNCSDLGENCWDSKCCKATKVVCYAKDLGWAQCKEACVPGVDLTEPKEQRTAWSCARVERGIGRPPGPPPPACSARNSNCLVSGCCKDPGLKCYMKDRGWAECKSSCTAGLDTSEPGSLMSPWSCTVVGGSEPEAAFAPMYQTDFPHRSRGNCSSRLENCTASRCCCDPLTQCYERDRSWAGCLRYCIRGVDWSCNLLEKKVALEQAADPSPSQSLYCFALMLPFGYEVTLLKEQLARRAGIFQCDQHAVFSNTSITLGGTLAVPVETLTVPGSLQCEFGGVWHTALNTEIFVRVWKAVFHDGRFRRSDWSVKVDPDTVFLPSRLGKHVSRWLQLSRSSSDDHVYLNNCKDGLHGPLEIMSRGAMRTYSAGIHFCEKKLKGEFSLYGEDVFLRHCMALLGVGRYDDFGLLFETVCDPFPTKPTPCTVEKVAFHPLKNPDEYFKCLAQAEELDGAKAV